MIQIKPMAGNTFEQLVVSHRHYKHPYKPNVVTIPGHAGDDVPVGTLKSILKAAGLYKK
jgi:predicted RNA binding protein YcfA (HicA-like mRNA interferase family)